MLRTLARAALGALVLASVALAPARASACGGLFCGAGANQVVNQVAERILFLARPDGRTTAIVEIQYQGPAPEFAWILPVPGTPEVGVSSSVAFDRLQQRTNPRYTLTAAGTPCSGFRPAGGCSVQATESLSRGGAVDMGFPFQETDPVAILDSGTVGPFDFVTLGVMPDMEDPADVAVEWLDSNGYDVTALGPDVLRPYLEMGMNLMAFRLTNGADTGSIRPLMLTYESERPMLPIRPTAVAAENDMGILVWVAGPSRALPTTYRHLVLNEAALDWRVVGANYPQVVGSAADEAGGHGFVTELATPTEGLVAPPELPTELRDMEAWVGFDAASAIRRALDLLTVAPASFASPPRHYDGVRDVVDALVPRPEGVTVDDVLGCADCVLTPGDLEDFDLRVFLEALDEQALAPVEEFERLLMEQPYVTRLFTTLSPEEMTVDPEFAFTRGLADVSNEHTATMRFGCHGDITSQTLQLADGTEVLMPLDAQPWQDEVPYVLREEQLVVTETASALSLQLDNAPEADERIARHNREIRGQLPSNGGCGAVPVTGAPLLLALLLLRLRAGRA